VALHVGNYQCQEYIRSSCTCVEADYKYVEQKEQANVTTQNWNVFVLLWSLLKSGYMDLGGINTQQWMV